MENALEFINHSIFNQFAVLLMMAAFIGLLVNTFLKQPLLIAYIIVGVLAGGAFLGINAADDHGEIVLLAELGIALLLFIVGLKLDLNLIKNLGRSVFVIGVIQIALTAALSIGAAMLMGYELMTAAYIAVALSFSSTIIVVKILSDKHQIDDLHGQISLGVLIVQDFAVIIAMMFISTIGQMENTDSSLIETAFRSLSYLAGLLLLIWLFIQFAAEHLVNKMARSSELLLCFSLAWAVFLAAVCEYIGLGKELGGLFAGISIASTPYRDAIISRLTSVRDFLLLFFFVSLGAQLNLGQLGDQIGPALALSALVLFGKPAIIFITASFMGFRKRTAFKTGISLSQISEFSFIFIGIAVSAGVLEENLLALVTLIGLITISVSTYGMEFSGKVFPLLEPVLNLFERNDKKHTQQHKDKQYDYIIFGYGRYGQEINDVLLNDGKKTLIIDYNPDIVEKCYHHKMDAMFGDANDPDLYEHLPLKKAKWVISAMPRQHTGLTHEDPRQHLLHGLKSSGYKGQIAIASADKNDTTNFTRKGADIVLHPFEDAAKNAVESMTLKLSN